MPQYPLIGRFRLALMHLSGRTGMPRRVVGEVLPHTRQSPYLGQQSIGLAVTGDSGKALDGRVSVYHLRSPSFKEKFQG